MDAHDLAALEAGLIQGQARFLAKAITLIESSLPKDRQAADKLLTALLPRTGPAGGLRLGISGIPGVGKSTLIENLGKFLLTQDPKRKIGILTIDPSSPQHGGSILADKTRMEYLAAHPQVFIRPSPAGDHLGGVARRSREALLLMEAAGYPLVLVETVGVGQSEHMVASMVDLFVLLQMPATGDELQGIKRGILELADLVVVNKADGPLKTAAATTAKHLTQAFSWLGHPPDYTPQVILHSALQRSALQREAVENLWTAIMQRADAGRRNGRFAARRQQQAVAWFHSEVDALLRTAAFAQAGLTEQARRLEKAVHQGHMNASVAARELVQACFARPAP